LHTLRGRSGAAEVEAEQSLAAAFGSDFAVDLFCVIAALGNGLGAGFEPCLDLSDFGIGILQGINPIPFGGEPVGRKNCDRLAS